MRRIFRELHDRKVFRVGLVYLAAGWLVLQVADVVVEPLGLPAWSLTLVVVLVAIGFPIAVALAWAFQITPEGIRRDAEARAEKEQPEAGQTQRSVAILPFLDLSPERDQEYFVDGLSEELLSMMSAIPALRVASRTSCFAFKNQQVDVATVGGRLGVAHVVEGSVRKDRDRLRITVKLVRVATDSTTWNATYDRTLDDVFAIQRDIAAHVAKALKGTLGPQEIGDDATTDPRAYEYYLRGRGYFITHGTHQFGFARRMFEKAVEIDPDFARAWAGLAATCASLAIYHGGGAEAVAAAETASRKAVEFAPDRADSHAVRGMALLASEAFEEAGRAFEKALSINPEHFDALYYFARARVHEGRIEEAAGLFERAAGVNPDDYECPLLASSIYEKLGEAERARASARRGLENVERHLEDYPDNHRAYDLGACALVKLGETRKAIEWSEKARALSPNDVGTRYNAACVYAQAGELDRAFECLRGLPIPRSWIENDSDLDALRDDPRYATVGKADG
jgi:TolB-like protein/Flp pilus assembly protein TadD